MCWKYTGVRTFFKYAHWITLFFLYYLVVKSWSEWGAYGACSVSCGYGEQLRYRTCESKTFYGHGYSSDTCTGLSSSKRRCNAGCCPGMY